MSTYATARALPWDAAVAAVKLFFQQNMQSTLPGGGNTNVNIRDVFCRSYHGESEFAW